MQLILVANNTETPLAKSEVSIYGFMACLRAGTGRCSTIRISYLERSVDGIKVQGAMSLPADGRL